MGFKTDLAAWQLGARLKLTGVALVCCLAILVCVTALFPRQTELVQQATSQQAMLVNWQARLEGVIVAVVDAESAADGYLLTGDASFNDQYQAVVRALPAMLIELDALAITEPSAATQLQDLRKQVRLRLAKLDDVRSLETRDPSAVLPAVRKYKSDGHMQQLRRDVHAISLIVRDRRQHYAAKILSTSIVTQRLTVATVAVLVIMAILAVFEIVRLMNQHARSERALADSESFMRAVADNVPVRLAYSDTNNRFKFVNQALADRFGVTREAFVGHTLAEVSEEAEDMPFFPELSKSVAGEPQRYEYVDVDKKRGIVRHIETHLTPHFDAAGKVLGVFGVGVDITHRKAAERTLRDLIEVFDATSDYVAQTDCKGRLTYINPAARRALGLQAGESVRGRCYSEFFTPETNARWPGEIIPAVKRDGIWVGETEVKLQGGRVVPTNHMVLAHRDAEGYVARYSSIIRDISEAVVARHELARQTATLNAIIEAMPALVAVCDLTTHIRLINKSFERWSGKSRAELVGAPMAVAISPAEYRFSLPWMKRALAGETVTFEKTYPAAATVRHVSITYIPLRLEDGRIDGFIGVAEDITRHREENLKLRELSEQCPLTGLLNRSGFETYLDGKLARGEGGSLAIIYIDLDHFKPVNDTYGHAIGDEVLCEFGSRLARLVRPSDAVARLGGDEFALALSGVRSTVDAVRVADKVIEMARQPLYVGELQLQIGASVGVAFGANSERGWKDLVARADAMAYRGKREGGGRAVHEIAELTACEEAAWLI